MVVGLREISPKSEFGFAAPKNKIGRGRARVINRLPCRLPVGVKQGFQGFKVCNTNHEKNKLYFQTLNEQKMLFRVKRGANTATPDRIANQLYWS
jgi:hypothetical protein